MNSTICAISTATGVGAISIIRCSGPNAIEIVNSVFKGKDLTKVLSHTINYGHIIYNDEIIDEVLVSVMRAPKTFTTEDIVEINSHGGPATTNKILEVLLLSGCKLAEPGEFTKRAFLNGRIDLLEAEAVGDLINAETDKSRKLAINQLNGSLTSKIQELRKDIIDLQANIEVNIDFPEYEEGEDYTKESIKPKLISLSDSINDLLKNAENSKLIKQGIDIALVGKPNVGKSSILNAFLEEEKAIVTSIPGTTRDIVEGRVVLNGIILNLIDTAGIRQTDDVVEKIGVEKSINISENADLNIFVCDNSTELTNEEIEILNKLDSKKLIIFINKSDLDSKIDLKKIDGYNIVFGNTKDKDGLNQLKKKITELFNLNVIEQSDYTFLSNARQISLIKRVKLIVNNIIDSLNNDLPIDVFTIDLRDAYDLLGEIIGETYKDDLLDELFSKFCLGK